MHPAATRPPRGARSPSPAAERAQGRNILPSIFEFRISITGSVCFSETSPTCIFKGRQAERNFQHLRKRETRRKMTLQDPRNYVIPSISKDQINYLFLIISVKNQLKIAFKNL